MKSKNYLDEMQDRELLKIEEVATWLAFWGLFIAIAIQFLLGGTLRDVAGEIIVFAVLSGYLLVSCIKNGIWARDYKPTVKTNAVFSIFPALAIGVLFCIKVFRKSPNGFPPPIIAVIALSIIGVYAASFLALELVRRLYRKRHEKLEETEDE